MLLGLKPKKLKPMNKEEKKTEVINGGVYCKECGQFLGDICDPFRAEFCRTDHSKLTTKTD